MATYSVRQNKEGRVVYRKILDLDDRLQQAVRSGWFEYLRSIEKGAQKSIRAKDKRGRLRIVRNPRTGRRKRHRSSAPGQSHARMFGALGDSISWKVHGWDKASFGYGVSTTATKAAPPYAGAIEFGSSKRRIDARPTLQNAIDAEDPQPHWDTAIAREFPF